MDIIDKEVESHVAAAAVTELGVVAADAPHVLVDLRYLGLLGGQALRQLCLPPLLREAFGFIGAFRSCALRAKRMTAPTASGPRLAIAFSQCTKG